MGIAMSESLATDEKNKGLLWRGAYRFCVSPRSLSLNNE
jgi:hypothetical protein